MSTKRKAQQNSDDDLPSLKSGRPVKEYSISDAVKMVSFMTYDLWKLTWLKEFCCRCFTRFLSFSYFFLRRLYTANIFASRKLCRIHHALRACCLDDVVSIQKLHYHDVEMKRRKLMERRCLNEHPFSVGCRCWWLQAVPLLRHWLIACCQKHRLRCHHHRLSSGKRSSQLREALCCKDWRMWWLQLPFQACIEGRDRSGSPETFAWARLEIIYTKCRCHLVAQPYR